MTSAALASFRVDRGLSISDASRLLGIHTSDLYAFETGRNGLGARFLSRVKAFLNDEPVRSPFEIEHVAACRAVFRAAQGRADPAEAALAHRTCRHGYPRPEIAQ
jgi:hypothetical protein